MGRKRFNSCFYHPVQNSLRRMEDFRGKRGQKIPPIWGGLPKVGVWFTEGGLKSTDFPVSERV